MEATPSTPEHAQLPSTPPPSLPPPQLLVGARHSPPLTVIASSPLLQNSATRDPHAPSFPPQPTPQVAAPLPPRSVRPEPRQQPGSARASATAAAPPCRSRRHWPPLVATRPLVGAARACPAGPGEPSPPRPSTGT